MSDQFFVHRGDCLEVLKTLESESFDSLVTDPPAGISFMGADWDGDKGGRDAWIAWLARVMFECLRVLKPGAHALVWALPRTSHWTATAIENAGFEVRDVITHHFGSGFPKSLDVSKAIDAHLKVERKATGHFKMPAPARIWDANVRGSRAEAHARKDDPATAAAVWSGWGTALKPGTEHWILARKPMDAAVAVGVIEHGTGAINIDACRVGDSGGTPFRRTGPKAGLFGLGGRGDIDAIDGGRWPTNLLLSHTADCTEKTCDDGCPVAEMNRQGGEEKPSLGPTLLRRGARSGRGMGYASGAGPQTVVRPGYIGGGASRFFPTFFYQAKPSRLEKEGGLEDRERAVVSSLAVLKEGAEVTPFVSKWLKEAANIHPTVKPVALMRWLVRLITPKGGRVLDPFTGSGTTGLAVLKEGGVFVGVEMNETFHDIALKRLDKWHVDHKRVREVGKKINKRMRVKRGSK